MESLGGGGHHTAFSQALGDRKGIVRFGFALAPLDEALARAVVDVSGRPFARTRLKLKRERLGDLSMEMIPHMVTSFAMASACTVHLDVLRGQNDHHKAESAFKALALALRQAAGNSSCDKAASTKGTLI